MPLAAAIGRELVGWRLTFRRMKPRSRCRCTMAAGRTIRLICGSTVGRERSMVFDFQMGRGREGPKKFLGQFEGILQTDGYAAL